MKIFAFTLSMPGVSSWNGRWSGEKDLYVICRKLKKAQIEKSDIVDGGNYFYKFDDGWGASINVRVIDSKEHKQLTRRSDGFAGYDWMVDSIIKHGLIKFEEDEHASI